MMGFDSANDYTIISNDLLKASKKLIAEFPTIQNDIETERIFILATAKFNAYHNARTAGDCKAKLINCRDKADAVLALAVAGCIASVFIPAAGPFIGVGCQIAALYNHYVDYEKCNLDYEDCKS